MIVLLAEDRVHSKSLEKSNSDLRPFTSASSIDEIRIIPEQFNLILHNVAFD